MIYDCDGKYESIRNVLDYKIDRLLSRHLRENDANRIKIRIGNSISNKRNTTGEVLGYFMAYDIAFVYMVCLRLEHLESRTQNLCAMEVIDEITKIEYLF